MVLAFASRVQCGQHAGQDTKVRLHRPATAGELSLDAERRYCERYPNPTDKGAGRSGGTRKARYRHLYAAPESSFNGELAFEELLFEPFYQLMRLLLLGDRMLVEGVTEELSVADVRVVVVCPTANEDFRRVVSTTPLGRRFPDDTVRDVMQRGLKEPRRFDIVAQDELVAALRGGPLTGELQGWLDYHARRYGW